MDEPAETGLDHDIRAIDYTVIFARDMAAMRTFYEEVMQFPLRRELGPQWIEYSVGSQILAMTEHGSVWKDTPTPKGQLSLQLAFRVTPDEVASCAEELEAKGIEIQQALFHEAGRIPRPSISHRSAHCTPGIMGGRCSENSTVQGDTSVCGTQGCRKAHYHLRRRACFLGRRLSSHAC
jgi:catechol 2,3-dioxygenase-like lactoylglutathione lyase family enzyme